jgi:hypothetical protein
LLDSRQSRLSVSDRSCRIDTSIAAYGDGGAELALTEVPLQPRAKRAEILTNLPGLDGMIGKRGRIEFSAPGAVLSVLGIRFAQQAFTAIPVSY